ncbi:MAG TPA: hypothetical protein ENI19_01590 [Candidatus Nealsonbacteria bacterium]|uniref:Uncharacterized protein n=1 Tax=marine sediment metagenome TaxID=412755 RepID=A0A0F9V1H1_9ZZZZ|nr:hypothetical protein [Candidatus Nealsonbacteria bacterium]HEB46386.1 hypothetical protein [Candidatus Nealsonbacteria bacterium]
MKQISIHGYRTKYEDEDYNGIKYLLQDLQYDEAKVFFEQARLRRSAQFEDDFEGQYTISYNSDGTYTLSRR